MSKVLLQLSSEKPWRKTFLRDDHKKLMELDVVRLGGEAEGFSFKLPGADSNALWMAKTIYFNKTRLLSKVFPVSVEEQMMVKQLSEIF